jgi:hypothetical protein
MQLLGNGGVVAFAVQQLAGALPPPNASHYVMAERVSRHATGARSLRRYGNDTYRGTVTGVAEYRGYNNTAKQRALL